MDQLYLLSLPIVSAFNFSQILVIPLLVCLLAVLWYGATGRIGPMPSIRIDAFILIFLVSAVTSITVNANNLTSKSINHLLAVFTGWLFFYFLAERITRRLNIERILALLFVGYMSSLVFGIAEFLVANFTTYDINSLIPRPAVEEYTPGFLDIVLIRARSFFEESGYFGAYLAMLMPLMVYYLWHFEKKRWLKSSFVILTITGYFIAFSVSLFIFLPTAIFFAHFLRSAIRDRRFSKKTILLYLATAMVILLIITTSTLFDEVFLRKFEGNSFEDRYRRFSSTIDLMSKSDWTRLAFGYGPGSYYYLDIQPAVSVYLNFLRDFGILGVLSFLTIQIYALINTLMGSTKFSQAIFTSLLIELLFFISTPIYFLPHYYIPLLLYRIYFIRMQNGNSHERTQKNK